MAREKIEKHISYDKERKLYYVYMYFGKDDKSNKPKHIYKTYPTRKDAKQARDIHLGEVAKKTAITPSDDTLQSYMKYYLDNIVANNCSPTTHYSYKNIINKHLATYFKNYKLQDISVRSLNEYYSYKITEGELGTNTIRKHHDLLSKILNNAVLEELLRENPASKATPPKLKKKNAQVYTIEESRELLRIAKGHRLEMVITLAIYLGLRRGEILGLKWDSVDTENNKVFIKLTSTQAGTDVITKAPKTDSSNRGMRISDDLSSKLEAYRNTQLENKKIFGTDYNDNNLVICWDNGKPYRPNYISELFKKFIKDTGLKKITLHSLRHTFVSIAIDQGVDIVRVSKAAGHSRISTTSDVYSHLLDEDDPIVTNVVADALRLD